MSPLSDKSEDICHSLVKTRSNMSITYCDTLCSSVGGRGCQVVDRLSLAPPHNCHVRSSGWKSVHGQDTVWRSRAHPFPSSTQIAAHHTVQGTLYPLKDSRFTYSGSKLSLRDCGKVSRGHRVTVVISTLEGAGDHDPSRGSRATVSIYHFPPTSSYHKLRHYRIEFSCVRVHVKWPLHLHLYSFSEFQRSLSFQYNVKKRISKEFFGHSNMISNFNISLANTFSVKRKRMVQLLGIYVNLVPNLSKDWQLGNLDMPPFWIEIT